MLAYRTQHQIDYGIKENLTPPEYVVNQYEKTLRRIVEGLQELQKANPDVRDLELLQGVAENALERFGPGQEN